MDSTVFERIRGNLLEKRRNLAQWLRATPAPKLHNQLGTAGETAVRAHLHTLDSAIEQIAGQQRGRCEVCHEEIEPELLEMDYDCCVCLEHLSADERRQLEWELELSQTVQKALLPQQVPAIPGVDIAVFSRPAQIVGGDYFDFFELDGGSHALAIGDVAGHGMAASMLVASLQTALHTLIPASGSLSDALQRLNHFFYHNVRFTTFVTLFLGQLDRASGELRYCNAGHNPPLLLRKHAGANGPIDWLQPTGPAIGLVDEFQATIGTIRLAPGDLLLIYTDGLTEAANPQGEEFGPQRLAALAQREAGASAKELLRSLRRTLDDFASGQPLADDITIIACKLD